MEQSKAALTFYYRPECHLCDDMWQHLQRLQVDRPFRIEAVNVDSDATLAARFGPLVPVLADGDQVLCNYYLDPVALMRHLDEGRITV